MSSTKIATAAQVRTWAATQDEFAGQAFLTATQGRLPSKATEAFNKAHKGLKHTPAVKAPKVTQVPIPSVNSKGVLRVDKRNIPTAQFRETLLLVQDGVGSRGRVSPDANAAVGAALATFPMHTA